MKLTGIIESVFGGRYIFRGFATIANLVKYSKPNYTYRTLSQLRTAYPDCDFTLIVGSDNWLIFDKWRNWQEIIDEFGLLVYPRPGYDVDESNMPANVRLLAEAPVTDLSSTEIREALTSGKDTSEMLNSAVRDYIISNGLYLNL